MKSRKLHRVWMLAGLMLLLFACKQKENVLSVQSSNEQRSIQYPIQAVNIQKVKLTDNFWLPIIKRVQEKTIEYALQKCKEEGRLDNFLIAGGQQEGPVHGVMPFDDTDVYKIIEGASISLISAPNSELEILLDSLIAIIAIGQEEDGYLTTWRTIDPAKPPAPWVKVIEGKRWESLEASHEMYNPGHLYEAAYTHYLATGKKNFLNIALKNADLIVQTFGDGEGQISTVPGHQIIETGLIKLYLATGESKYKDLARYFLDNRGNPENHTLFGSYSQDHLPVIDQKEVVGHAVRAVYMYAAMTDIAVLDKDSAYDAAANALWHNMVNKKMYITGGIGARHEGESFGENYELPNMTAYNETCASIGNVYWNQRLHSQTGEAKYYDIIERTLYNGLISGLSLDGTHFFYPNALESDGVYTFNQGACTRKNWFDCSCCPTNVIRFIPSIAGLLYAKQKDSIYVNLYASSTAEVALETNMVEISQETDYPWNGTVRFALNAKENKAFTIKFRVPSWARNQVIPGDLYHYLNPNQKPVQVRINGDVQDVTIQNGYISMTRLWKSSDRIEIDFPMDVKLVETNDLVEENQGKVCLEYGPLVYAVEQIDNPTGFEQIAIHPNDSFQVEKEEILESVQVIKNENLKAIPYYAWSNRGVGKMKVWIDYKKDNN